jgi:hypothetical protein
MLARQSRGGAAKSGAFSAASAATDPELALIIDAWPALAPETRAAILALVRDA